MFGITIVKRDEIQSLRLTKKALVEQSERLTRERNELKLRNELLQLELKKYKPLKGVDGKFVKRIQS